MTPNELKDVLAAHALWLKGEAGGERANLQGANLRNAKLRNAKLQYALLQGADLRVALLQGADLRGANLQGANLQGADLRDADLRDADLRGADLQGAKLPEFDILPKSETFKAFKKVRGGIILELEVQRQHAVCSLVGRKCRASEVLVVSASGPASAPASGPYVSLHDPTFTYQVGEVVRATLDTDIRVECTSGVHFFLTHEEAVAYGIVLV